MQHNMIAVKNTDILQEFNTLSYNHTIQCHIVSRTDYTCVHMMCTIMMHNSTELVK